MSDRQFSVTWDYLCPFARNAHEHLLAGLEAGAPWAVTFSPFCLVQTHLGEDVPPVWDAPEKVKGVLALQAGIVVRDRFDDRFPAVHQALFAARHDEGRDIGDTNVVGDVLERSGVSAGDVFKEIEDGWPLQELRTAHEASVKNHHVFGVPTFVLDDRAVFVRLMTRPEGDRATGRSTIDRVLDLMSDRPELNEFKYTTVPR